MSNKAQEWAKAQKVGNSGAKFVLWILSDCAGPDGASCFPTINQISEATELNERSVRRHLDYLDENKFLTRYRFRLKSGRLSRFNYRLNMGVVPLDKLSSGDCVVDTVDIEDYIDPPVDKLSSGLTSGQFRPSPVDKLSAPKPSLKPLKNKKEKALTLDDFLVEVRKGFSGGEFEEFNLTLEQLEKQAFLALDRWKAYPKTAPDGELLPSFRSWLRQSKAVKKLSSLCKEENVSKTKTDSPEINLWRNRVQGWLRNGFWKENLFGSAPPNDPRNIIPQEILAEYQGTIDQIKLKQSQEN